VSGILFHARIQRLRSERDAGDVQPQPEIPVVVPAPAPPVPLVLKPADVAEEDPTTRPRHGRKKQRVGGLRPDTQCGTSTPRRARRKKRVDGLRPLRTGAQTHARRPGPVELRWEPVPRLESEPPRWGTP
jgi:hypothetical protein